MAAFRINVKCLFLILMVISLIYILPHVNFRQLRESLLEEDSGPHDASQSERKLLGDSATSALTFQVLVDGGSQVVKNTTSISHPLPHALNFGIQPTLIRLESSSASTKSYHLGGHLPSGTDKRALPGSLKSKIQTAHEIAEISETRNSADTARADLGSDEDQSIRLAASDENVSQLESSRYDSNSESIDARKPVAENSEKENPELSSAISTPWFTKSFRSVEQELHLSTEATPAKMPLALSQSPAPDTSSTKQRCPKLSISSPTALLPDPSSCELFSERLDVCHVAEKYYGKRKKSAAVQCRERVSRPICFFNKSPSLEAEGFNVKCDWDVCGKRGIVIGSVDPTYGLVTSTRSFANISSAQAAIVEEIQRNLKYGIEFLYISCGEASKNMAVHQALVLPPAIEETVDTSELKNSRVEADSKKFDVKTSISQVKIHESLKRKLNINLVVLDSVSRHHFYRMLPSTVRKMRAINKKRASNATVLDFTSFQSLAPFTFLILQALLTGSAEVNITDRRLRFADLLGQFRSAGYQTLVQEDTCWYDQWGSIFTNIQKLERKITSYTQIREYWNRLWENLDAADIDSFGLSFMVCDVMKRYNSTNIFQQHKEGVCLNGKTVSSYLLDYVENSLTRRNAKANAKPLFAYTHINAGHEETGLRIQTMDKRLATFVNQVAQLNDTLTVIWSDHGGKTTDYAMKEMEGRFEVYDPFLFMVVPSGVEDMIGERSYENLVNNQKSVVSVIDLRNSLLHLLYRSTKQWYEDDSEAEMAAGAIESGLFSSNRHSEGCTKLAGRSYMLCKCLNHYHMLSPDSSPEFFTWLGEFAIGKLNNRLNVGIHASGLNNTRSCRRLVGLKMDKILEEDTGHSLKYIFDVEVEGNKADHELFTVHVEYDNSRILGGNLLRLKFKMRSSLYSKHASCKDIHAELDLCICSKKPPENRVDVKLLRSEQHFKTRGKISKLGNSTCLVLLCRNHSSSLVVYEVLNLCDIAFDVSVSSGVKWSWQASENLPLVSNATPKSVTFLVAFIKMVDSDERIQPLFAFEPNQGIERSRQ